MWSNKQASRVFHRLRGSRSRLWRQFQEIDVFSFDWTILDLRKWPKVHAKIWKWNENKYLEKNIIQLGSRMSMVDTRSCALGELLTHLCVDDKDNFTMTTNYICIAVNAIVYFPREVSNGSPRLEAKRNEYHEKYNRKLYFRSNASTYRIIKRSNIWLHTNAISHWHIYSTGAFFLSPSLPLPLADGFGLASSLNYSISLWCVPHRFNCFRCRKMRCASEPTDRSEISFTRAPDNHIFVAALTVGSSFEFVRHAHIIIFIYWLLVFSCGPYCVYRNFTRTTHSYRFHNTHKYRVLFVVLIVSCVDFEHIFSFHVDL